MFCVYRSDIELEHNAAYASTQQEMKKNEDDHYYI